MYMFIMEIPHSELTKHHLAKGVCVHSGPLRLDVDKRRNKPMAKVNRSIKNDKEPEIQRFLAGPVFGNAEHVHLNFYRPRRCSE